MSKERKPLRKEGNPDKQFPFLTRKTSDGDKTPEKGKGDFSAFIKRTPKSSEEKEERPYKKFPSGDDRRDDSTSADKQSGGSYSDRQNRGNTGYKGRSEQRPSSSGSNYGKDRPYDKNKSSRDDRSGTPFRKSSSSSHDERPFERREDRLGDNPRSEFKPRFPGNSDREQRSSNNENRDDRKPWPPQDQDRRYPSNYERRSEESRDDHNKPAFRKPANTRFPSSPFVKRTDRDESGAYSRRDRYSDRGEQKYETQRFENDGNALKKLPYERRPRITDENDHHNEDDSILRLNKFIAQTGLCSRRKAAELVKKGEIKVNGKVENNPAYEMKATDVVTHKDKVLKQEEKLVYILMNKPKNTITSVSDEKGRKTVLDLLKEYDEYRLFPVGRLDRNTTGLLLLTNDGELASKLSHPSFKVKKFYHATLDKNLKPSDLDDIRNGIVLEDGPTEVDEVSYIKGATHNEVGIEIHIGKNRIVRRIFEHLGYEVVKLDRTYFGGLTKKDLPRGFSRELNEKEVIMLKHFTQGK